MMMAQALLKQGNPTPIFMMSPVHCVSHAYSELYLKSKEGFTWVEL